MPAGAPLLCDREVIASGLANYRDAGGWGLVDCQPVRAPSVLDIRIEFDAGIDGPVVGSHLVEKSRRVHVFELARQRFERGIDPALLPQAARISFISASLA